MGRKSMLGAALQTRGRNRADGGLASAAVISIVLILGLSARVQAKPANHSRSALVSNSTPVALAPTSSTANPLPAPTPRPFELGETPFDVMMKWHPSAKEVEAPDFVVKARRSDDELEYLPIVGVRPSKAPTKDIEQLAREKAKLAAAAQKNKARAAHDFNVPGYQPTLPSLAPQSED